MRQKKDEWGAHIWRQPGVRCYKYDLQSAISFSRSYAPVWEREDNGRGGL